ncbi:magnesium transporter [Paralimibaculum aggregatum]|uniref:Magnesium transporter MgtE n=1 Tax=Paralimibaculum aggregatum TaxID=3036245 RepID=A0ABQ6LPQ8_9RHOB|nr:magnesium transporter [Limibaculum sp. NKW23]GMG84380.1 magnesium transporter [Limibaculum sp. NKW23]
MTDEQGDPGTERVPERAEDEYLLDSELFEAVVEAVEAQDAGALATLIADLHVADLADLVEQLKFDQRIAFLTLTWPVIDKDVLAELQENVRDELLPELDPTLVAEALRELDTDDAVYVLEGLEDEAQEAVVEALEPSDRAMISKSLTYPDYSAGRLMQSEFVKAPPFWTVGQMIDEMRNSEHLPEQFYDVVLVDPAMRPLGKISLARILGSPRPVILESLMDEHIRTLHVEDAQEDVAYAFNQYHLVSCPVVDDDGRVVGVITIDDAMEVLEDEAEEDIKRLGGVGDEEITDRVWAITRRRFPWLAANLATAILASAVIAIFDDVIGKLVALAILMPIVASMGGNAGTQTLTVAVRALATRDLTPSNMMRTVGRETLVGLLNGLLFALVIGAATWALYGNPMLGAVIAAAMVVNMLVAGLAGILIPIGLERIGADPALASGTFVTTVTDVVGFFTFLGLAALLLL